MNRTGTSGRVTASDSGRLPAGAFLDRLPAALYVVAHLAFVAAGVWLWSRANGEGLSYSGALWLYAASQVGFFAYFAKLITMKVAVLAEQMLVFAMLLIIVLSAT